MTDEVRKLMNAEPFRPFFVKTSGGKQYRVKHPDYLAISPKGGRLSLFDDEETTTTISALHIVSVEHLPLKTRNAKH
ncbi:MAG TPA: hypothetical protein VF593_11395 [Chthoniobacteraceae bacterium]